MDFLSDPVFLARMQFAFTAMYHFLLVPISIGLGLIVAIYETRAYRSGKEEDAAASRFWIKIFTATFALGVATGITMEFSFGTNWADYSRFVGDIFGAPLAAEALLAFFLESTFLGVLLFGRNHVSKRFYLISAWLVFFGSALSALWIIIANSWMQTPGGAELSASGTQAVLTNFFAAAFNPSTLTRYSHVICAVLIMGAFGTMAVAAWYMHKKDHEKFALRAMKIGSVVATISCAAMLVTAHSSAVVVSEEQPTKFAMMEGMYESEVPPLYAFGWVDEESQEVLAPFAIPGGTSFLANGTWDTEYDGLNALSNTEQYGAIDPEDAPVNLVFQSYHLMVAMFGLMALTLLLALIFTFKGGSIKRMKWLQWIIIISPLFAVLAIQSGWATAEFGRQPWVVYPSVTGPEGVSLLTADGVSLAVSGPELIITLTLFALVYLVLFIAWARIVSRFIKQGPVEPVADKVAGAQTSFMAEPAKPEKAEGAAGSDDATSSKEGE
ncbi:cytochrome ubiquinol oxidase subunit I [Anaerotardibacter muris]|uniref:cytochrome ubiquinol oxidase subunit I n=1 Tax=Anaerotardibacter muris TaxID=2941505 RepID=UPI00203FCC7F|nr:cytochrome ubiquinol oxidase subunit I [Anaerotardibacter muris]